MNKKMNQKMNNKMKKEYDDIGLLQTKNMRINKNYTYDKNCKLDNWTFKTGIPSSSAGVNDLYIVENKYNGIQAIMKTHIGSIDVKSSKSEYELQTHENDLNEELIYNLTTNFVLSQNSPNFVMKLDSGHKCSFEDLCSFLSDDGTCNGKLTQRIIRNYLYIFCKSRNRPALQAEQKIPNELIKWCDKQTVPRDVLSIGDDFYRIEFGRLMKIKGNEDYIKNMSDTNKFKFYENMIKIGARYGYIVLEKITGKTLDSINLSSLKREEFFTLLFILTYNISLLSIHGVSHNDLHFGNIFMDTPRKDETRVMKYVLPNGEAIIINNVKGLVPRFFDYDRSSIYGRVNIANKYNTFSSTRDYVQLMSNILNGTGKKYVDEIKKIFVLSEYQNSIDMNIFKDPNDFTARDKYGTSQGIEYEMFKNQSYINPVGIIMEKLTAYILSNNLSFSEQYFKENVPDVKLRAKNTFVF